MAYAILRALELPLINVHCLEKLYLKSRRHVSVNTHCSSIEMSKILTKSTIEQRIANGDVLVIYKDSVLRLNSWLRNHPGGDKAILHMVGRDATDEINGYHSKQTIYRMKSFAIGKLSGGSPWLNRVPPIQGGFSKTEAPVPVNPDKFSDDEGIAMDGSCENSDSEINSVQQQIPKQRRRASVRKPSAHELIPELETLNAHQKMEIERDLRKYPSLDHKTQSNIQQKYRELADRLEREGYHQCHYADYAREVVRWVLFASISVYFYQLGWYKCSAVFLGIFWHQVTFAVHDAGHTGVTHSFLWDGLGAATIASFVGGLSVAWWKRNHNVHHLVTNQPEHDPDIQHMPIFAITPRLLSNLKSTYYEKVLDYDAAAKTLVKVQRFIFYPVMLFGRFNLYRLSYDHLIFNRGPQSKQAQLLRVYETVGICFFLYWYAYLVVGSIPTVSARVWFVLISHWVTAPLHVQITLSHFAMSTVSLGPQESFAQQQLRTTMDVDCPASLDWIHGGLQFQAIHHLFPRIPRHRLREVQPLVRAFAEDVGIEYKVYGFGEGNGVVLTRLAEVTKQAKILSDCAKAMRDQGDLGMNLAE
ncbi:putative Fatty acid desaturase [Taphrina deformans PYCC 5710]|uniref:Delta 8-(E)-sphingolipid desaturase n=1 Tax=Taphrina deformans (strain PYCC 5710 / ATCC 11124 / CBS 356.35 / IMI 108563 / JCM 9778 / NBRC 8474) TaxID=1097556 RepID=R4X9W4_TAPDE|nr:putative Fatty acid desaturase [Taphrina deformans PYCC 5710]|eukprot:CCG82557.1 putative Fatty acid desaturase [Taphrina deformans PYCC 5710]